MYICNKISNNKALDTTVKSVNMKKIFEINGRTYAVVSTISDRNCYRLVYLPTPETSTESEKAINLIDDTACEDYYGDIDTVSDIMAEQIREDAEKPYPWWTLFGALFEWGGDPYIIEDEESARLSADAIAGASMLKSVNMDDEEEANTAKELLDLIGHDVTAIHEFTNGSSGSFCLSEEWC